MSDYGISNLLVVAEQVNESFQRSRYQLTRPLRSGEQYCEASVVVFVRRSVGRQNSAHSALRKLTWPLHDGNTPLRTLDTSKCQKCSSRSFHVSIK